MRKLQEFFKFQTITSLSVCILFFNEAQRLCSHEIFHVIFPFGHVLIPLYLKQKVLWLSDLFECCSCSELGQFKHKKTLKKDENCSLKHLQERISTLYSLRLH